MWPSIQDDADLLTIQRKPCRVCCTSLDWKHCSPQVAWSSRSVAQPPLCLKKTRTSAVLLRKDQNNVFTWGWHFTNCVSITLPLTALTKTASSPDWRMLAEIKTLCFSEYMETDQEEFNYRQKIHNSKLYVQGKIQMTPLYELSHSWDFLKAFSYT